MDSEHKIIFEELAAIRASTLHNTKLLQKLIEAQGVQIDWTALTKLLEADQNRFLKSIQDRLGKESS